MDSGYRFRPELCPRPFWVSLQRSPITGEEENGVELDQILCMLSVAVPQSFSDGVVTCRVL